MNAYFWLFFTLGLFIGTLVGIFIVGLMNMAKRGDAAFPENQV